MFYNGKEIDLAEYVAEKKKDYEGLPAWRWEDEGIVWAVQEYYGSMGEFSEKDLQTLDELFGEHTAAEVIALCEEN